MIFKFCYVCEDGKEWWHGMIYRGDGPKSKQDLVCDAFEEAPSDAVSVKFYVSTNDTPFHEHIFTEEERREMKAR